MNDFFIYLLQSAISITVFYLFFELLFKREAYFKFNRYYLLSAIVLSALLPLSNFSADKLIIDYSFLPLMEAPVHNLVTYSLSEVTIYADKSEKVTGIVGAGLQVRNILLGIYLAGVFVSLIIFSIRVFQLSKLFNSSSWFNYNGSRIIYTKQGTPTFSFYKYIFINKELFKNEEEINTIVEHEKVHIEQKHTVDLFIAELLIILQWFNPMVYSFKKTLKENHEFIADNDVIGRYPDVDEYKKLLIDNSSIIGTNVLTHNFSYSLLKRRLHMIRKTKNPFLFTLKLSWVLLALSIVLYACSDPESVNEGEPAADENVKSVDNKVLDAAEIMPQFPGGMDELKAYLSENIVYPAKAMENNVQGKVIIGFIVNKNGDVSDVKVLKGIGSGCDEEAVRIVTNMPAWIPGKNGDETVNVSFKLPISFVLSNEKEEDIFAVVEVMPKFPGGTGELMKYLSNNIKYPEEAFANKVDGRVFVSFVVEKDGKVSDVSVLRGIGHGCDKEAIRVVESMPNWNPGTQKGKPVRVKYNLPIRFVLE